MKHFAFTPIVASLLLLFTGCSKDRNPSGGTGTLNIQLEMDDHIDLITRTATTKATPDLTTFTLEVVQGEEIVEKLPTIGSNTSPSLTLAEGDYTVKVYSQPFTAPGFDLPVYGASQDFSILAGETKAVALECVQTNAGVVINYSDEFQSQYSTYSTRITCASGSLDFSGSNASRTGYFPAGYVTLTITADGQEYEQEILLKGQRLYNITIKADPLPVTTGDANISISVSTAVTNEDMEITFPTTSGGDPEEPETGTKQTLFSENLGDTPVSSAKLVLTYSDWQNQPESGFSFSGSGKIEALSEYASSGYSNASGGNYLLLSNGNKFNIEGLNTTGYTSLTFTFGLYCMTGSFDPSQLTLYVAEAGSAEDGTPLSYSYQSGSDWMLCTVSSSIPTSDNLRLRLISNGSFRIDDLTLSGIKQ